VEVCSVHSILEESVLPKSKMKHLDIPSHEIATAVGINHFLWSGEHYGIEISNPWQLVLTMAEAEWLKSKLSESGFDVSRPIRSHTNIRKLSICFLQDDEATKENKAS
jgi:hypothetical protein